MRRKFGGKEKVPTFAPATTKNELLHGKTGREREKGGNERLRKRSLQIFSKNVGGLKNILHLCSPGSFRQVLGNGGVFGHNKCFGAAFYSPGSEGELKKNIRKCFGSSEKRFTFVPRFDPSGKTGREKGKRFREILIPHAINVRTNRFYNPCPSRRGGKKKQIFLTKCLAVTKR